MKHVALAFVFGGLFSVIAAALRCVAALVVPPELVDPVMLAALGALGAIMYAGGLQQRIEPHAGAGSFLPLNGFSAAVAGAFDRSQAAGQSLGRALFEGFMLLVKVILSGTFVVMVLAAVVHLVS